MGIALQVKCDECGKERGETNHWYMGAPCVYQIGSHIKIEPLDTDEALNHPKSERKIFCGEGCACSWLSRTLSDLHR